MNHLTTLGESLLPVQELTRKYFTHQGINTDTVKLLPKQNATAMAQRTNLRAQSEQTAFGMLLSLMSNTEYGAECLTENATPLFENGRKNTEVS